MALLLRPARPSTLLVLAYHRITGDRGVPFDESLCTTTPEALDRQLAWLKRRYEIIGADDIEEARSARAGNYALVTFDDGYRDNFENALPVLLARGVQATFFVATGFIDNPGPAWWDEIAWMVAHSSRKRVPATRWFGEMALRPNHRRAIVQLQETCKRLAPSQTQPFLDCLAEVTGSGRCETAYAQDLWMTWDMVRQLHDAGMEVAGHTHTHPCLSNLSAAAQQFEISRSQHKVSEHVGKRPVCFAYPFGSPQAFNETTRACLSRLGVRFAFSLYGGRSQFDKRWDRLDIPRVGVTSRMALARLQLESGSPSLVASARRLRRGFARPGPTNRLGVARWQS